MKALDLFSGIGGFGLGLERAGMETVAFCEWDAAARKVLTKHWPEVPQYHDVKDLTAERLAADGIGSVELICGGFPCQPHSYAGLRQGERDKEGRYLWPEFCRLIRELRPRWIVAENVVGLLTSGISTVLQDLENQNYRAWTFVIPASAIGARHQRERVFIIGQRYSETIRGEDGQWKCVNCGAEVFGRCVCNHGERLCSGCGGRTYPLHYQVVKGCAHCGKDWDVSDPDSERGRLWQAGEQDADYAGQSSISQGFDTEGIESRVDRVVDGFPGRVDRLKQLGNAVVPQIAEVIGRAIMEAEKQCQH